MIRSILRATSALAMVATLSACSNSDSIVTPPPVNVRPSYLGTITTANYNGSSDDLLTAGLGWDGLQSTTPPAVSTPPTAAELRRRAIYNNYRALVDMTTNGGYGSLWGPNVALDGSITTTPGAGKIAGTEYVAYILDGSGRAEATVMVQVPSTFSSTAPCIVTATSSGSRGVYGAVSAAGEWGLKRGCAVAYTDKGTGNGAHELGTNTVTLIDGLTASATAAGSASLFTATLSAAELAGFNTGFPNRYAYKHAHSQANPEKDWGRFTLQAVEFAFFVLNEQYGLLLPSGQRQITINAANATVLATSVSNGGGAAIAAAEQDTNGLIDAVVVGEPQVNVRLPAGLTIARGGTAYPSSAIGRTLYDFTSLANLLQPCAAYATAAAGSPLLSATSIPVAGATARCAALAAAGIIGGGDFQTQANNALQALIDAGWQPESNLLHASHWSTQATPGVAVTYANAYSRARVIDNLCGFSFATTGATTGQPAAPAASPMPTVFAQGNGVPPTAGINLVYNDAQGGAILHTLADGNFAFNGANCLRTLWTGANPALRAGVEQIRVSGNLRGKPAIIVHGRADALVPVNFASRAYFGANRVAEGNASQLTYIEVENAQHFDAFLGFAGYDTRFLPLHYYNIQALNLMWNRLRGGGALPPSQVVRTTPRGGTPGAAPAISVATNLPPIAQTPAASNLITFNPTTTTVQVPN
jgi:hydroxybutyrate-dimer hydrolase